MAEQVVELSTGVLRPHPQNPNYFDDIDGEEYERFKDSIAADGEVIEPIIIAPDMTIISGHQRYRACCDLGYEYIKCIIDEALVTEEDKLRKLIAANFGRIKNDEAKTRKAITEYLKLNGNSRGGDRKSKGQNGLLKSLQKIADKEGISPSTIKRWVRIEKKLSPEVIQLLDSGEITQVTALLLCNLPKEEQIKAVNGLEIGNSENSINSQLKAVLLEKEKIQTDLNEMKRESKKQIERHMAEIIELKNREPERVEVEVSSDDYDDIKETNKLLIKQITDLKAQLKVAHKMPETASCDKDDSSSYLVSCTIENVPDANEIDSSEERNDLLETNDDLLLSEIPCVNSHMRFKYRILERALDLTDEKNNLLVSSEDYKRFICEYDGANYQKLVARIQKYKTRKT